MAWLAVDKDGTEKVSNTRMIRRSGVRSILFGRIFPNYSKNDTKKWSNGWSTDNADSLPFYGAVLPKGSILKLIGRKLTWKDEPVELNNT